VFFTFDQTEEINKKLKYLTEKIEKEHDYCILDYN